jgi:hypothetical protein
VIEITNDFIIFSPVPLTTRMKIRWQQTKQ